jgi:hypothetical protein
MPSGKDSGSDARKVVQRALMINRAARIEDAQASDPGSWPYMRSGENCSAFANLSRPRNHCRRMPNHGKLHLGALLCQVVVDLATPPVVSNCYHYVLDELVGANAGCVAKPAEYRISSPNGSLRHSVVQVSGDPIRSRKFNCID